MADITGTSADDVLFGTVDSDTLKGLEGDDTLSGLEGSDQLEGGAGSDVLIGGEGNDVLYDESGDDVLDGGDGDDTMSDFGGAVASLSGGAGDDAMWTGANMTGTVDGGSGRDVLFVTGGNLTGLAISNVEIYTTSAEFVLGTVAQLDGFDTITTFDDLAHAASLVDIRISGGGSLDLSDELGLRSAVVTADATAGNGITTGVGDDQITGGSGNDTFDGGSGNDTLVGAGGNDSLLGSNGSDVLIGGEGKDRFFFDTALNAQTNVDNIVDFTPGKGAGDLIVLSQAIFTGIGSSLSKGEFHIGNKAADGSDLIIYDKKSGNLSFDSDGKGGAGGVLFATLDSQLKLSQKDFEMSA